MLMTVLSTKREKYITPRIEADEMAPDILCDSLVQGGGELEGVEEGDPWTF